MVLGGDYSGFKGFLPYEDEFQQDKGSAWQIQKMSKISLKTLFQILSKLTELWLP